MTTTRSHYSPETTGHSNMAAVAASAPANALRRLCTDANLSPNGRAIARTVAITRAVDSGLPTVNVAGAPLVVATCCGVVLYDSHGDQLCTDHR